MAVEQLALRISSELLEEIDDLTARLASIPRYAPRGSMTRSDCLRLLLVHGLDAIKAQLEEQDKKE